MMATNEEIIEVPVTEYEAIKAVAAGIAEQNMLVLDSVKAMTDAVAQQGTQMRDAFVKIADALAGLNVVVNVPTQPAPVVNVAAPKVTNEITVQPADVIMPKPVSAEIIRDPKGRIKKIITEGE